MTHPNAMVAWGDIACQRSHDHHAMRVEVDLSTPHLYGDYPQVPERLQRAWSMMVWDTARHPVDGGPYCPAHDAVSETIVSHRIWEPRETILAAQVLSTAPEGSVMYDLGAQLGWYSLLAALYLGDSRCPEPVRAFDADQDNLTLLLQSATLNGWVQRIHPQLERIGPDSPLIGLGADETIRFAKLDLEGAEEHAIRMLWPSIEAGRLDHMLMEVSPCFAEGYPELVRKMIDAGYEAYMLPEKHRPPWALDDLPHDLADWRLDSLSGGDIEAFVASWHQEDVWFAREGASW